MRKKAAALLFCLFIGSFASADLIISLPKVSGRESKYVEIGASPQVVVLYKNPSLRDVAVSEAEIFLSYDPSFIDYVISVKNSNPDNLYEAGLDIFTPGEILYKLESSAAKWNPIKVPAGKVVELATITFHVDQTAAHSKWVTLIDWSPTTPSRVFYKTSDVTGTHLKAPPVYLERSASPAFKGLSRAISSNSLGVSNVGNTVILDWRTPGEGAFDRTKYHNGKLSFRVFRKTADTSWVELSTEPLHIPEEDPGSRDPYLGNVEGEDYVFQDGPGTGAPSEMDPLDDGKIYYYKVTAVDDTSPDPNEASTVAELDVVPLDQTPPGEVSELTATPDDNQITLGWKNPEDADLGGIVIVKNEGAPVGRGDLGRAQSAYPYENGPEYSVGDEPFGPGNGRIIEITPQEDLDASIVMNEFVDYDARNGKVYSYKVFTYDRAIDYSPRETGRNYSDGVMISRTAGIPPQPVSNFIAAPGFAPGEITLSWNNSPDAFYGGVLLRYTTDDALKFAALRDERAGELAEVVPMSTFPGDAESITLSFLSGRNYYFKAFAYNYTDEELDPYSTESMAGHLFSAGQTAAISLPEEEVEEIYSFSYDFQRGINHFAVPFPAERIADGSGKLIDISTWEKLIDELNKQAGANVVLTFGRWNEVSQRADGIVDIDYTKTGTDRFTTTSGATAREPVIQGGAYEITVSQPFTFTLMSVKTAR